jgi:hypothetical protein
LQGVFTPPHIYNRDIQYFENMLKNVNIFGCIFKPQFSIGWKFIIGYWLFLHPSFGGTGGGLLKKAALAYKSGDYILSKRQPAKAVWLFTEGRQHVAPVLL